MPSSSPPPARRARPRAGRRSRAANTARSPSPTSTGTLRTLIAAGWVAACRRPPNGRRPRAAPTVGRIPGARSRRPSRSRTCRTPRAASTRGSPPWGAIRTGASVYGVDDMAGNVSEWTADWYSESYRRGDTRNPRGPAEGYRRELRGGGRFDDAVNLVLSRRFYAQPETRAPDIGFRCAQDASR
ncbi:MAG: hypothetical protein C6Y20_21275 [Tagaea sp. CACIAM 22H2]|nr:hypothetical protein [Tagaea sp. CACIAM 22H2]